MLIINSVPIFLEHRQNIALLRSLPANTIDWSMLCPSTMTPESASTPPLWKHSWVGAIPLIGRTLLSAMNAGRYVTTLEQNAEFIAGDLEMRESRWSGVTVGVIDGSK
jgi:hypothetical protein